MVIYVVSKSNQFGGSLDGGKYLNDMQLYDDDCYLYRQEWRQGFDGRYSMKHEWFVKTVNQKWISNHSNYYGCPVLDNVTMHDLATEYDKFVYNMESYC
jgi:hypothetical protein